MAEVLLAPGRAVNVQTLELPPEVALYLGELAEAYRSAAQEGEPPIVIVSGYQRSKFVYRDNPLRYSNGDPVVEADLMGRLLEDQGVPCWKERRSGSVGDNLAYSKQLLLDLPDPVRPTRVRIFSIASLAYRLKLLGKLVFDPGCDVQVHAIEVETQTPKETEKLERKLLGDQLCMLLGSCMSSRMAVGNHAHIIGDSKGMSRWPALGEEHNKCQYAQADSHPEDFIHSLLQDVGINE